MMGHARAAVGLARCLALGLLGLLMVGCVSTEERRQALMTELSRWEGRPVAELIEQWGPPASQVPDGQGGFICSYDRSTSRTTPGHSYPVRDKKGKILYYYHTAGQTQRTERIRNFYVDGNGIIYKTSWKGL